MSPPFVLADVGTPLMWGSALHLLFGNALIGVLEGWLLARLFKFKSRTAILLMIPANYVSCIVGLVGLHVLAGILQKLWPDTPPLFLVGREHVMAILAAYLATVAIEWPFCRILTRGTPAPGLRAWKASLVAQTASYALLVPAYATCSPISMVTVPELRHDLAFVKSPDALVYFIAPSDGAIWRVRLDGSQRERVLDAGLTDSAARLFVRPSENTNRLDLWCVPGYRETPHLLLKSLASHAVPLPRDEYGSEPDSSMNFDLWQKLYTGRDLRPPEDRAWTCEASNWAGEGLGVNHGQERAYSLAMETPISRYGGWEVRNDIIMPGDQVIFQAADQILVLDMPSRQLGFLTMGRGPVVALPDSAATSQAAAPN